MQLERMQLLQFQQQEVMQACAGWSDSILDKHTHVDSEATAYVQKLQSHRGQGSSNPDGGGQKNLVAAIGEKVVDLQQGCMGSEMPSPQTVAKGML